MTDDFMDLDLFGDGETPVDNNADTWRMDDMEDIHKLLAEEPAPAPAEDAPTESRAVRRERQEAERRAAAKKTRAKKLSGEEDPLAEDDPFWSLSRKNAKLSPTPAEPEPEGGADGGEEQAPGKGKPPRRGKGEKKEKPEKPDKKAKKEKAELSPEEAAGKKSLRVTLIVLGSVLALLILCATVGGYLVSAGGVNLPNMYAGGIFVGGMTQEETDRTLADKGWDAAVDTSLTVKLPAGVSFELDSCLSGAKLDRAAATAAAYNYGHDSNWYVNLYKYLMNCVVPYDVELDQRVIDESYVRQAMAKGVEELNKATADDGYEIDEKTESLVMLKGAGQIKLDEESLYVSIENALLADSREMSFDQLVGTITMPDFDKLHTKLAVEPVDAAFTETFEIVEEIDGVQFDVSEAEQVWKDAKPGDKINIPMELTFPEVTGEKLTAMLYRDMLGSQTTLYTWSTDNRINNIKLAASKLDGLILMPGQELSYNETIGQRTEEAGFLPAGAYDDGKVVEEIGGGICQVSSTLYCAIMLSQLDTVDRTNHYFKVDYLDYGLDATVSWPKPDFKFRNSREYPVKIAAYCSDEDKSLTIEIWGTDVDGTYVTLRHSSLCVYDTTYVDTCIGYGVSAFRTLYDAEGNYMYEIEEPYGIYHFHEEDISWPDEYWMSAAEKAALEQAYTDDVPA